MKSEGRFRKSKIASVLLCIRLYFEFVDGRRGRKL